MTKAHARIIEQEMKSIGFDAKAENDNCIIGLYRRFVAMSEVRQALEQVFGEIEFSLKRIDSQKVRVS